MEEANARGTRDIRKIETHKSDVLCSGLSLNIEESVDVFSLFLSFNPQCVCALIGRIGTLQSLSKLHERASGAQTLDLLCVNDVQSWFRSSLRWNSIIPNQ